MLCTKNSNVDPSRWMFEMSDRFYTLPTNGSYIVPYRFYVERKGSIPSHFQEKVLHRNRLGSGFRMKPYSKRSHRINCYELYHNYVG